MNTHHNQPYLQNLITQSVHMLSDTIIIGRHQDCNLVLKSERGASRKHARITIQNGNAVLMDLGSLNGTLVNGREITRAVQLADGDIVIFDEQEYRFTDSTASSQSGSDNVTVIVNKDEIGRPDRIKPAIRLVETAPAPLNNQADEASLDETKAWDSLTSNLDQTQGAEEYDTGQRTPAVSRKKAEYERQQRDLLTQKLQTQKPQAREWQAPEAETQKPLQSSQAQTPYDQGSYDKNAHGQESQASTDQEEQSHTRIYQPAQGMDAFEWHPDEPREVKLPAQQQPANRQQPYQAAPQQAEPQQVQRSQDQHSAPRANMYDDYDQHAPIPTTSRPGGGGDARPRGDMHFRMDERSTRPGLQKHSYKPEPQSKKWTAWLLIVPLIFLIALGAAYLVYNAGVSAGSSSGFS